MTGTTATGCEGAGYGPVRAYSPAMGMDGWVGRLAPGSRRPEVISTVLLLVIPLVLGFPLLVLIGLLSMGEPAPCWDVPDPTACGVAELEHDRAVLFTFGVWIPALLFVGTLAATVTLLALGRRAIRVALLGVGLMGLSVTAGLTYRILEL